MDKVDFVLELTQKLDFLPIEELNERIEFYIEMIDDRMDKGLPEEEAVSEAGTIDEIVAQTIVDMPLGKIAKEKMRTNRRLKAWEIVLLVLGSPVWLSVLIAVWAVFFSLYVSLWSVVVSLWAVFVSMIACGLVGVMVGLVFALASNGLTGIVMIASGIISIGLAIFFFFGCKAATKGMVRLTKKFTLAVKNRLIKGEKQ